MGLRPAEFYENSSLSPALTDRAYCAHFSPARSTERVRDPWSLAGIIF